MRSECFEGLFWIGMTLVAVLLAGIIGCSETNSVHMTPEDGVETSTFGGMKTDIASEEAVAPETSGNTITIVRMSGAPAAPSIIGQEDGDDLEIEIEAVLKDKGIVVTAIVMEGALVSKDVIKLYYEGDDDGYFGRVRIPTGAFLEEIVLLVETDDLPDDEEEIVVLIFVERDGEEVVEEESNPVELEDISSITLEKAEAGEMDDEIRLTFSDDVNATRSIKENISVFVDNEKSHRHMEIRSYEENGNEVTLIMSKGLVNGTYEVSYNGKKGLEGLDGEAIEEFEEEFEVAGRGDATNLDPKAWRTIPTGRYDTGAQILWALNFLCDCTVSPWAKEIFTAKNFPVEQVEGETHLYRLTAEGLGLAGSYTMADVIMEIVAQGYKLVPAETAAQLRLLYANQPENELLTVLSTPQHRSSGHEHGTYVFAIGGGSAKYPGKWVIALNVETTVSANEYGEFIVTK